MNDGLTILNNLLKSLKENRESIIRLSADCVLAKMSDFLDEADFDIAKAIRNVKQAIKLAGKKR